MAMYNDSGFEADLGFTPDAITYTTPSSFSGLGDYLSKAWGTSSTFDPTKGFTPGTGIYGTITNAPLMQGLTGLGNLGLGLASYFQQKPLLEAQKNALNQNIAFAKQDQDQKRRIQESARNWRSANTGVA